MSNYKGCIVPKDKTIKSEQNCIVPSDPITTYKEAVEEALAPAYFIVEENEERFPTIASEAIHKATYQLIVELTDDIPLTERQEILDKAKELI